MAALSPGKPDVLPVGRPFLHRVIRAEAGVLAAKVLDLNGEPASGVTKRIRFKYIPGNPVRLWASAVTKTCNETPVEVCQAHRFKFGHLGILSSIDGKKGQVFYAFTKPKRPLRLQTHDVNNSGFENVCPINAVQPEYPTGKQRTLSGRWYSRSALICFDWCSHKESHVKKCTFLRAVMPDQIRPEKRVYSPSDDESS